MHRLIIIEDQTAVRELLVEVLALDTHYQLVGQYGDGHEALKYCLKLKPDVIVLDAKLPSLNGVDLLRQVIKQLPKVKVLVFSGSEDPNLVREMIQAGAQGFVEKTASIKELKTGLSVIAQGGTYFGPSIAAILRDVILNPNAPVDVLTSREREVLQLVAEGNSTKEIGTKLGISAKTADNHRTNLMRKLNIHDVAGLVMHAINLGLVEGRKN